MDTRDPLRLDCPHCGAMAGQLCTSDNRVCSPHESRRRRRQPKRRDPRAQSNQKRAAALELESKFVAAGSVWSFRTNSRELLRSIGGTLAPAASPDAVLDLSLSFHVDRKYEGIRFAAPCFRSHEHLFFARYSPRETMLIDQLRGVVIGSISCQTATDANYWRTVLLPVLLGIVSSSVGITPVHCACLSRNGSGLLISGCSGVGKSTLSAFLCLKGFAFISDDCAYITRGNGGLLASGLTTTIKLLPDAAIYLPQLTRFKPHVSLNGELAFEIDPQKILGALRLQACQPRWLVFLERGSSSAVSFKRLTSDEAVVRFASELEMLPPRLADQRTRQLATIRELATLDSWVLTHNVHPAALAEILKQFCDEHIPLCGSSPYLEGQFHDARS